MSGIRSIHRGPSQKGPATAASAPIRVDDTNNTLVYNPFGSGSTEVAVQGNAQVSVTANLALTSAANGNYATFVLNQATGGATVTLPPATGSGAQYSFYVGTALGSGSYIVKVANAQDFMRGVAWTTQDGGDTALSFDTADTGTVASETDTITLNGGTTGGVVGSVITVRDIIANTWFVELQNKATGSEATPFSVGV